MSLSEKLMRIQTQIKAPKNLYNSFGKYKYRNAEGICEAVKPYLEREKVILVLSDEVVEVGGRVYIQARASMQDTETDEMISVMAYAREAEEKKGMDDSQVTGTASSYARKYALNGLFLLDDTKDADSDEYKVQMEAQAAQQKDEDDTKKLAKEKITSVMAIALETRCKNEGVDVAKMCELYKVKSIADLNNKQYRNINDFWSQILEKAKL